MPKLSDNFSEEGIDDLIAPVCQLADLETYQEAPDLYDERDEVLDGLILAARKLRDREGFLVVEGDDAGEHEGCGIDSQSHTARVLAKDNT